MGARRLSSAHDRFRSSLDTIEGAYEFMLAYAAQGRDSDAGQSAGPSIRETLNDLAAALGVIANQVADCYADDDSAGFVDTLREDATKAAHSVQVALKCERITSQLVDNLNASMHLRAVLTGLFLADEALDIAAKPQNDQ